MMRVCGAAPGWLRRTRVLAARLAVDPTAAKLGVERFWSTNTCAAVRSTTETARLSPQAPGLEAATIHGAPPPSTGTEQDAGTAPSCGSSDATRTTRTR